MFVFVLLIGHFIADFFLQSADMAELKKEKMKYLLIHSGIYAMIFLIISFACLIPKYATIAFLVISITHFIIDFIRCKIDRKIDNLKYTFVSFLVDQALHIGIIFSVYYFLNLNMYFNWCYSQCSMCFGFQNIVLYIFLFALLMRPSAVFVKKLLVTLFPLNSKRATNETEQESQVNKENPNVGSIIGILERMITAILLLCNQYAAIGLVLTAKSIARFKQLEEQEFAEKYLIGTLTSLSISLIATLFVKSLML